MKIVRDLFIRTTLLSIAISLTSVNAFATSYHAAMKHKRKTQTTEAVTTPVAFDNSIFQNLFSYIDIAAGYSGYKNTIKGTGSSTLGRLGIGSVHAINDRVSLGGEFGIQSGDSMVLDTDLQSAFGYTSAVPLILTIKPIVDLLFAAKYHFNCPVFIEGKVGAAYLRTMTDNIGIQSESLVRPEGQFSVGYDINPHFRAILTYQYIHGQTPKLTKINVAAGTADLNHLPTEHAGMIELQINA